MSGIYLRDIQDCHRHIPDRSGGGGLADEEFNDCYYSVTVLRKPYYYEAGPGPAEIAIYIIAACAAVTALAVVWMAARRRTG